MAIDIFQSLKNCVFDLQRADVQNYQQPLKQLARLLNSENLQSVNAHLTRNVELDTFLARSEDTESSMAGSAVLQWPDEPADILGLKLLLIEKWQTITIFPLISVIHFSMIETLLNPFENSRRH